MGIWRRVAMMGVIAGLALAAGGAGCVVTIDDPDNNNNNGNNNSNDNNDATPTTIVVRVINTTSVALDPEIYISEEELGPNELFVRELKFTRLGIGNTGILDAATADSFEVECEALRVLGTAGGRFGDNLRDPDGVGRRLVLTRQLNLFCGDVVTLTYQRTADGFTTTFDVEEAD